jgi:heptosyltransferase-2
MLFPRYVYKKWTRRCLASLFDLAGGAVFFWIRWLPRPCTYRKILCVRLDQIGDFVLTLPALGALREAFPEAEMDLLVAPWSEPLAQFVEGIARVETFEHSYFSGHSFSGISALRETWRWVAKARKRGYDLAIDFRGDVRTIALLFLAGAKRRVGYGGTGGGFLLTDRVPNEEGIHQVERNLRCVEILGAPARRAERRDRDQTAPRLSVPERTRSDVRGRFPELYGTAPRPWIVLHEGSGYPSKRWPRTYFDELIRKLGDEKLGTVILVGSAGDWDGSGRGGAARGPVWDLAGKTSLSELCGLLADADIFVGNDSGPAHIAAALGKKVISLFSGTNDYRFWQPIGPRVTVLRHPVPCSPCHERVCPLERHHCMEGIPVAEVFRKVKEALGAAG